MSEPWWIKDPSHPPGGPEAGTPQVTPDRPRDLMRTIRERRPAFTPDWADPPEVDAGGAWVQLFAEQLGTVAVRANRLPQRARVEFLNAAGVQPTPARPAEAVVQFTVSPAAGQSVLIPERSQVGAAGASGPVVFETLSELYATPLDVATVRIVVNEDREPFTIKDGVLRPPVVAFEQRESRLEIGLAGPETVVAPGPKLSIGFTLVAAGGTTPIESGGPPAGSTDPVLRWEAVGKNDVARQAELVSDGTRGLTQSGIVVLRTPPDWEPAEVTKATDPRFWVRARLAEGKFGTAPQVQAVRVNVVAARAVRTVRDEFPDATDENRRQFKLRNVPVVPDSVVVVVDRPILSDDALSRLSAAEADRAVAGTKADRWEERRTLAGAGPDDRVFVLDSGVGVLTFGDGVTGTAVPPGARSVKVLKYEVGGGTAGAVKAGAINQMITVRPFVTKVNNPLPASGGTAAQTDEDAIRSGPRLVRGRGRAIMPADYEDLARSAPGADVRRALAIAARHPLYPGVRKPGVVGVWVVTGPRDQGPPSPDQGTLQAVSDYLAGKVGPVGVRVVAAAPRFRRVRAELRFRADPTASPADVINKLLEALDNYFDPLTGGESRTGWAFGGPIRHTALVRRLFDQVPVLQAVTAVRLVVDGVPFGNCQEVPIGPTELLWRDGHTVTPDDAGGGS